MLVRISFVVLAVAVALAAGMSFAQADGSGDPTAVKQEDGKYLDKDGNPTYAETVDSDREVRRFFPEKVWTPTPEELAAFKGDWFSDEAGASLSLVVDGDKTFFKQRLD